MDLSDSCQSCEELSSASVTHGIRLSKRIIPAYLALRGGDWCETFPVDDGTIALSIGDVCGHGEKQFATMTLLRRAMRDALLAGDDPAQALTLANALLYETVPGLHATAFGALFDTRSGALTFSNAGHPSPFVVSNESAGSLTNAPAELPLGVVPRLVPSLEHAVIGPQTLVVLYTDGVTERERDPVRGERELLAAARFAHTYSATPAAFVIEELLFLTGSNRDDASILTLWTPRSLQAATWLPRRRNRVRARYISAAHPPLTVVSPLAGDEIRVTLPGRHRWTGSR